LSPAEQAQDLAELTLACRLDALFAERLELARAWAEARGSRAALPARLIALAEECEAVIEPYERAWLARAKPSGLHEIRAVFRRLAAEARAAAGAG